MSRIRSFFSRSGVMLCLSALLVALPLSISSLFFLSWIGFIPFFLVLLRKKGEGRVRFALGRGIAFGFLLHFFVYFWFLWLYPLDFAGLNSWESAAVVLLAWVGISLAHGVLYGIPSLLVHLVSKKISSELYLLTVASLGVLLAEKITSLSELAFPWVRVSLGQYRVPVLIQTAAAFGIDGVDFLLLAFSALLALALRSLSKRRMLYLGAAFVLFVSNLLFGALRLSQEATGEPIRAMAVQGNLLSGEKWDGSTSSYEVYTSLTEENVTESVDLVVWPESAVPVNLALSPSYLASYQSLADQVRAEILMGCFWQFDGVSSNSAVLIDKDSVSEVFSKRQLVPFGERVPYRAVFVTLFPFLEKLNMLSSDLYQGQGSVIMAGEKGAYGSIICYESIFPRLCRQSTADGAQLLVVVTNDSWYEDSPAIRQHLAHSVFRSVENGRAVVRSANSGISAFIDHRGRILCELGALERGVLEETVSFSQEETLYTCWGDIFFPTASLLTVLWGVLLIFRQRRKSL